MQVPEQMSDVVVLASTTHKTRRSVKHGLEADRGHMYIIVWYIVLNFIASIC